MTLFDKILIANRGEIACRIIRTAKKLGIKTVAIFSEVDCNALHVKSADEAYLIGPAPSKDSYLNITKIIAIAKETKSSAIHPGYGFLSENGEFAQACEQENIVFIGPALSAINLMANKNVAKSKMQQHGIPILPGFYDENQSYEKLLVAAKQIGFPIVLKAVAGGGGKGLRLVFAEEEFEHAYHAVKREAKAFFNDDKILLEKYLSHARHVEVQILADHFGNVQSLLTRDCSIQRRHQKIIEEAPAPNLSQKLQEKMIAAAVEGAKAIHYTNAGTMEFLVERNAFYFMEMNTRLQVEHPVTEMITGLDLVEWQFRIAAGEKLFTDKVPSQGHAIEVRLNAEDPENDFLPSSGKLYFFHFPPANQHIRIDSGYETGDKIAIYYDSLLGKLIAWDENRSLTINRLQQLIDNTIIFGIKNNLPLLKQILNNNNFLHSNFSTHFLQQEVLTLKKPAELYAISALFLTFLTAQVNQEKNREDIYSPWNIRDGWQLYFNPSIVFYFYDYQKNICVQVTREEKIFSVTVNEEMFDCFVVDYKEISEKVFQLSVIIGNQYLVAIFFKNELKLEIILQHEYYYLTLVEDNAKEISHESEQQLLAPMPGTIVALHVNSGQKVTKGEKLLVIEAMKMEHTLYAPKDGIIKKCYYKIGDLIKEGSELLEFEA